MLEQKIVSYEVAPHFFGEGISIPPNNIRYPLLSSLFEIFPEKELLGN